MSNKSLAVTLTISSLLPVAGGSSLDADGLIVLTFLLRTLTSELGNGTGSYSGAGSGSGNGSVRYHYATTVTAVYDTNCLSALAPMVSAGIPTANNVMMLEAGSSTYVSFSAAGVNVLLPPLTQTYMQFLTVPDSSTVGNLAYGVVGGVEGLYLTTAAATYRVLVAQANTVGLEEFNVGAGSQTISDLPCVTLPAEVASLTAANASLTAANAALESTVAADAAEIAQKTARLATETAQLTAACVALAILLLLVLLLLTRKRRPRDAPAPAAPGGGALVAPPYASGAPGPAFGPVVGPAVGPAIFR